MKAHAAAFLISALLMTPRLSGDESIDLRPIIEQALDQPIDLELQDQPVLKAMDRIADATGVSIRIPPEVIDLLPYGKATLVSAELRNISLRRGLTELLGPLGMTFEVTDTGVQVYPGCGLARLGRTANWTELQTLDWLRKTNFREDPDALRSLKQRVQFRVRKEDPWQALADAIVNVGAGPGNDVLEVATDSLGWTWYPWREQIVIVEQVEQIERQLDTLIAIRKSHRPLSEVLRAIGRQVGVPIRTAPDSLESLPVSVRRDFSLVAENVTALEALEEISGLTGLAYQVNLDGVELYKPSAGGPPAVESAHPAPLRRRDPYVAKITVPDPTGTYRIEFLLRESDLSPEVNELRKHVIEDADEVIRRALEAHVDSNGTEAG